MTFSEIDRIMNSLINILGPNHFGKGCVFRYGQSFLHTAAEEGLTEIVIDLVHYGMNIDAINSIGFTPLQYAVFHGE